MSPTTTSTETTTSIDKVPASEFAVGDTFGMTKKEVVAGNGRTVESITAGPGGRVQLRGAGHKMIKSSEPAVSYWRSRRPGREHPGGAHRAHAGRVHHRAGREHAGRQEARPEEAGARRVPVAQGPPARAG